LDQFLAWFEQLNAWAAPVAASVNAPIWVVAGGVYGLVGTVLGIAGERARGRWMKRVEAGQAALTERAEAAETAHAETRELLAEQRELLERVLAQVSAQTAAAGVHVDPASEKSIRSAVEAMVASHDERQRAALEKAASGDVLGAASDLANLAGEQRSAGAPVERTAQTYRAVGALTFATDTHLAVRSYEAARELEPSNLETWNQLGHLYHRLGQLDDANAAYTHIIEADGTSDGGWRAAAVGNLGLVARARGDLDAAEEFHTRALDLNEKLNDEQGQAAQLGNLGIVAQTRGNLDAAEAFHTRSLALNEQIDHLSGQAATLGNLGLVARTRGDLDRAQEFHTRSLALEEELACPEGQANQLGNLGLVALVREDLDAAEDYLSRALAINETLANLEGQAIQLGNLGLVARTRGDFDKAEGYHTRSLAIEEKLERPEGQASDLGNLGLVARARGDFDAARGYFKRALALFEQLGSLEGQANQWANLGINEQDRGDLAAACEHWRRSHELFASMQHPNEAVVADLIRKHGGDTT